MATSRFLFVSDNARSLPAPPWTTDNAYAEAFELVRSAYFKDQPDGPRILLVFTTFEEGGRELFYTALANDVRGLGEGDEAQVFDRTPNSSLEGYAWMGALSVLLDSGPNFASEAFLHEIAHRWGAYVRIGRPGQDAHLLLGRNLTHWSFLSDSEGSPLEGNDWEDDGGDFVATQPVLPHRFSTLDLYLMGLVPTASVGPIDVFTALVAVEPPWFSVLPASAPAHRLGVQVRGRPLGRVVVTMDEILARSGPRDPPASAPLPVELPIAVALLSDGRARPTPARLAAFDERLQGWIADFEIATGGRMRLRSALEGVGRSPLGAPCETPDECERTQSDRCGAPEPATTKRCTRACVRHEDCGASACCVGEEAPGLCLVAASCGPPPRLGRDVGPALDLGDTGSNPPANGDLPEGTAGCGCRSATTKKNDSFAPTLAVAALLGLLWRRLCSTAGARRPR